MNSNPDPQSKTEPIEEQSDRREMVRKLGRFAAYAAPFTVLAFTEKANASWSTSGPHHDSLPAHR